MRSIVSCLCLAVSLTACGEDTPPSSEGAPRDLDTRRVEIYAAVIRDLVELDDETVFVWTRLCANAESAAETYAPCPESLTAGEREALASLLEEDVPQIRFVEETEAITEEIFDGEGGELVRLGPIEEIDGEVHVPAMHYCGNVCGGGSVWLVEEVREGWAVTGPAPGHGVWIS